MGRHSLLVGALVLPLWAGCLEGNQDLGLPTTDPFETPVLRFAPTVYPDLNIRGSEPALEVAPDGTVYVSKHLSGQASRVWRSTDGGATFAEISPRPVLGQDRQLGISGDGELAVDGHGNVYYSDLYLASATVYSSRDKGATWSLNPVASLVPVIDRQWLDAFGDGEIYLSGNQLTGGGAWTSYSTDYGRTFIPGLPARTSNPAVEPYEGRPLVDQKTGALYVPLHNDGLTGTGSGLSVAVSKDHARSWKVHPYSDQGVSFILNWMLARDQAGTLYGVALREADGGIMPEIRVSKDEGQTWSAPWTPPVPAGAKTFLWTRALEPGHLALSWFGTEAKGKPDEASGRWDLVVADVRGADGPTLTVVVGTVNERPVKDGRICTQGAFCQGNRELGDFFEMEFGPDGRLHFAWAETRGSATTVAFSRQL